MTASARVALIATGGTIDALGAHRLDHAWYTETRDRLDDGALVGSVPELARIAQIVDIDFPRMPSYALTTDHWARLAHAVDTVVRAGDVDAVVITHGTNTIEETAFVLSLTVRATVPIVLVGAMRPANALGSDGAMNLVQAVRLAASPQARGQGVLVLLNDTVFAARDVVKTTTFRPDAFAAPETGPLGWVGADGRVCLAHRHVTNGTPVFAVSEIAQMPRVDVVVSYVGADGAMIEACVRAGARGLVSAGTGAGRPTPAEEKALDEAAAAGVVVCQSTRVPGGGVSRSPRMQAAGRVVTPPMPPWKARIALALALVGQESIDDIQATMDRL